MSAFLLFAGSGYPPFDPGTRANLKFWVDASTYTPATNPTFLIDISGAGNSTAVQGTATSRMLVVGSSLNGKATLAPDGGDRYQLAAPLFTIPNGSNTLFVVSKQATASGAVEVPIDMTKAGSGRYNLLYLNTPNTVNFTSKAGGAGVSATGVTTTKFNIFSGRRSGTLQAISVDGGAEFTNTGGVDEPGIDAGTVGGIAGTSITGNIAEILLYNRYLSDNEKLQVEIYLANKWGIYHPKASWILNYSTDMQTLIHAFQINKDDVGANTTTNPIAAYWNPRAQALGSTTSLTDFGRGVNTATEATNPPVNTANGISTGNNGLLYNGTTTTLNAGLNASINDIFAAGGCYIGIFKPNSIGSGSGGCLFDKGGIISLRTTNVSGSNCKLTFTQSFSVTSGQWTLTNTNIAFAAANIVAVTYSSANVANNPSIYVNSLTAKAITQNLVPTLTPTTDASSNMRLGANVGATQVIDGDIGEMIFLKSVPTTAALTRIFTDWAAKYGVTLT